MGPRTYIRGNVPAAAQALCGLLLAGLTISFAPPAFAQQNDTVDAETAQQVCALASNYDAAFNRQDAVTIAGLYAQDAVFNTPEGTFHGRQAIEELYAKHYFGEAHSENVVTVVDEAIAAGNEVRATGTWSDTFEERSTGLCRSRATRDARGPGDAGSRIVDKSGCENLGKRSWADRIVTTECSARAAWPDSYEDRIGRSCSRIVLFERVLFAPTYARRSKLKTSTSYHK